MSDKDFKDIMKDLDNHEITNAETDTKLVYDLPSSFEQQDLEDNVLNSTFTTSTTKRSNNQLIKSLLYMGLLLKGNSTRVRNDNDYLINSLEMLTVLMDNINIITRFGIGKNSKILKIINENTSKIWFFTLMFNINRNFQEILKLNNLKNSLLKEIRVCQNNSNYQLAKLIIEKYQFKIQTIEKIIRTEFIELAVNLIDFFFISIEIFKFKVPKLLKKLVEYLSTFLSIWRLFKR
ncbi:hypothetical protein WICMUC_004301 [Wickerhamomyces mucosus]|uniref:Uncharacterized protein n=1 Tax=Wickerhamomyces mucosus TaxID=1378264 RepID=A0A9P8PIN2_9ASCO|nr:hypothetical protein WICMUC_004301 [Wickerhamomyces mucosus]